LMIVCCCFGGGRISEKCRNRVARQKRKEEANNPKHRRYCIENN
jgi:hypothetical protein